MRRHKAGRRLELGHILAVALDDQPLAVSRRILLHVMSEEQETNHQTEAVTPTVKRIVNVGTDPCQVREFNGTVHFKRPDAATLAVTALDLNGYPAGSAGTADSITLRPTTLFYLITTPETRPAGASAAPARAVK